MKVTNWVKSVPAALMAAGIWVSPAYAVDFFLGDASFGDTDVKTIIGSDTSAWIGDGTDVDATSVKLDAEATHTATSEIQSLGIGGIVSIASLDAVRELTGFVAGGTPGIGLPKSVKIVADNSLARYRWVWSAGGTPDTVYPVALDRLIAASGARWADVADQGRE